MRLKILICLFLALTVSAGGDDHGHTETGQVDVSFTNEILNGPPTSDRTQTFFVSFSEKFSDVPEVGCGVIGFSTFGTTPGFQCHATSITKEGFTLTVLAPKESLVGFLQLTWIATDQRDKIHVRAIDFALMGPEIQQLTAGVVTNSIALIVEIPEQLQGKKIGATVGIAGFQTDVDSDGFTGFGASVTKIEDKKVHIRVTRVFDSPLEQLSLTVVIYEKRDNRQHLILPSTFGGQLSRPGLVTAGEVVFKGDNIDDGVLWPTFDHIEIHVQNTNLPKLMAIQSEVNRVGKSVRVEYYAVFTEFDVVAETVFATPRRG